jgi:hypothetical protein
VKMAEMKMTKAEKKDSMPTAVGADSGLDYPYGLTLRLDSASLDKLGMDKLPKVGAKVKLEAIGVVTSVSQHESKSNDSRNVEIQLQELAVDRADPLSKEEKNELTRADFGARLEQEKRSRRA